DFDHINIYIDGKTYKTDKPTFKIDNLKPDSNYTAKFKTVDTRGNESDGKTINFRTDPKPELSEVKNIEANSKQERVDLSWDNPKEEFDKAKIYRKKIVDKTAFNWNPIKPKVVNAAK